MAGWRGVIWQDGVYALHGRMRMKFFFLFAFYRADLLVVGFRLDILTLPIFKITLSSTKSQVLSRTCKRRSVSGNKSFHTARGQF